VSRTWAPRSPLSGSSAIEPEDGALYRLRGFRSTKGRIHHFHLILRSGDETGYSLQMRVAKIKRIPVDHRALDDLISIGPATLRDFKLLGVNSVAELARQNPEKLYGKLGRVTGQRPDICVLDTFRAGVAQARNPHLPAELCKWWYWSRRRKARRTRQA
jgi:hypothetical protein